MYPFDHAEAITTSDTLFLNPPCHAFMVGVSGTVTFNVALDHLQLGPAGVYDSTAVQISCIAGFIYPINCCRIWATGTTATGIVALW
jgi:hypothetical protein